MFPRCLVAANDSGWVSTFGAICLGDQVRLAMYFA